MMDDLDHVKGFFHDVSEDNHIKSNSSYVKSGSRLVKLKKLVSKKTKGPGKMKKSSVKPPTPSVKTSLRVRSEKAKDKILDMSPDHNHNQAADSKKQNYSEQNTECQTSQNPKNQTPTQIHLKFR